MLVHDHKTMKSEVIDFRETAPAEAKPDMFRGDRMKAKYVSGCTEKYVVWYIIRAPA